MFENYPQIESLSTAGWLASDRDGIKETFRAILDSMIDFVDIVFAGDFFVKFPEMRLYVKPDADGNVSDRGVQNRVVAALLASYLHRSSLDLQDHNIILAYKLYEDVLSDMQRDEVGTSFWMLDNYYRVNRNNAYGKHGWQIAKMILFGSADNTARHGLLDETPDCNHIIGNTIIANGLLQQLTGGEQVFLSADVKRDVVIEFATMFDGYFKMYPPKYAQ